MLSLFFMTETMLGMQWYRNMQSRNSYQQWVFSRPYWPLWTTPLQKYEFILPILEINWLCVIIGYWNGYVSCTQNGDFFPCLPFELFSSLSYFILVHDPFKPNTSTWKKQVPAPFSHMRIFSCNSTIYIIDNLRILIPFSKVTLSSTWNLNGGFTILFCCSACATVSNLCLFHNSLGYCNSDKYGSQEMWGSGIFP